MCPERRETLIHQSDFTSESKHWAEVAGALTRSFRRDGYFYIGARMTKAIRPVGIPVADFKVSVDAQFIDESDKDALCGIVFRLAGKVGWWDKFYCFGVQGIGACALLMHEADKWVEIVGYKRSDFINKKTGTNSLMVEMVGDEITGWVNGHVLVHARDKRITRGDVGVIVNSTTKQFQARFRNFRLYSIEVEEEAMIMPAPMMAPAPPARPSAFDDEGVEFVIEKVTVSSSAKAPPAEKPRVTQPASSAQRPSDVRTYLEGIIDDAGMTAPTREMQEEMIQELTERLNAFIISEIINHMPKQYLEAFTKLYEQNRPQAEINRFIEEHMPNAGRVITGAFEKFRGLYGGKSSR